MKMMKSVSSVWDLPVASLLPAAALLKLTVAAVTRLVLVSHNTLAVYCSNVTILYDVCSTPIITTSQSCRVGQLSLNELKVFHATVSGTPHFCSEEVYVLQKDSTLTVVYKDTTNWTILLLTPPTDQVIYASCSQVGNETFFLSYWDSGQTYLTHVAQNVTNLIGRNTRVSNVPPKIFQQRYAVVNNRSESLVFNFSCTAPQIQVNHPHHLATVVVAETTHEWCTLYEYVKLSRASYIIPS